jgi:predicted SAM-dependent methyltransferase
MMMKLHIGGNEPHPDWKILDIEQRPEVDFIGNAGDLSQFGDQSIEALYASHVLEHFYYALDRELSITLAEWHRVLKVGGQLLLSVPDMRTLCWLYSRPDLEAMNRLHLMRMMFGGQTNQYDVHKVGFDIDILSMYLAEAGFTQIERVAEFNLFKDCSCLSFLGSPISLNIIATK